MFDQEILNQIRSASDIAQIVGEYVPLKKAGSSSLKGLCPFHKERTPSFHVNTALQIFKCFGCGAGGNVITFLMRIENAPFADAVKRLAELARIELPQNTSPAAQEKNRLLQLCETTATLYQKSLKSSADAARARDYLVKRKISPDVVTNFRIGFCGGREVFSLKVHPALLITAGLAVQASDGRHYDRMRGRLVLPITDDTGHVIGFGGRALEEKAQPKYMNSPETPLYKKSSSLYALAKAKDAIRKEGRAVLVEGYFDAIAAHAHGVQSVVAVLGTSLTGPQLRLLKRLARELVIVYDEDVGGNEAALRGLDLASEEGFNVKIARLPGGLDPDEFIIARGPEEFLRVLGDAAGAEMPSSALQDTGMAISLFDFRLEIASRETDPSSLEGRTKVVATLLPFLSRLPNAIERHAYVKRLAERLDLRERDVSEEIERYRAGRPEQAVSRETRRQGAGPAPRAAGRNRASWRAECLLIAGVLRHKPAAVGALLDLPAEAFPSPDARALAEHLRLLFTEGTPFSVASLVDEFQSNPGVVELLSAAGSPEEEGAGGTEGKGSLTDEACQEAATHLRRRHAKGQLKAVQQELEKTKDPEAVARLLEAKQRLACANSS